MLLVLLVLLCALGPYLGLLLLLLLLLLLILPLTSALILALLALTSALVLALARRAAGVRAVVLLLAPVLLVLLCALGPGGPCDPGAPLGPVAPLGPGDPGGPGGPGELCVLPVDSNAETLRSSCFHLSIVMHSGLHRAEAPSRSLHLAEKSVDVLVPLRAALRKEVVPIFSRVQNAPRWTTAEQ